MRARIAFAILLFFSAPIAAEASCGCFSGLWHDFSYFACADFQPVADLAYQADDPTGATSGIVDTVWEQGPVSRGDPGVAGDGKVTVFFNWTDPGAVGCPGDLCPGSIMRRVVFVVQGADGNGLIATLGRGRRDSTYQVESAHKRLNPQGQVAPIPCSAQAGRPQVLSREETVPGQVTLGLHFAPPLVYSDCDPDSRGFLVGSCTDGFVANPAIGRVWTRVMSCSGRPDIRRTLWTDTGQVPDAAGDLTLTVSRPTGAEASLCRYVGMTALIGGFESGAITGFVRVPGTACPDTDGDGWSTCEGDCNDGAAAAFPGNAETCDLVDNDCDGAVDEGSTTCGAGACQRTVANCSGGVPQTCVPLTPGPEICDGIDNDCNGLVDEADPDGDGYRCAGDCDETNPAVHVNAPELCDGIDNDCDGRIDDDHLGEDFDGDAIRDACDNCVEAANSEQHDADTDGAGDACDLDDGEIFFTPASPPAIAWQDEEVYSSFNLYGGDLDLLRQTGVYTPNPDTVPLAMRQCSLPDPSFSGSATPPPGKALFFHVTGNCDLQESGLGSSSSGVPRPNTFPCPQTDLANCPRCDKAFTRYRHGDSDSVPDGYFVIDNASDWGFFCAQIGVAGCNGAVDFTHQVAIVGKLTGNDTCYDVEVGCVQTVRGTNDLHVVMRRTVPGPGCGCFTVITNSYDAVIVERPVGSVSFETKVVPLDCRNL